MHICAVVVWYNPQKLDNNRNAIENIKSYSSSFRKVYIIDNSNSDNGNLAMQIDNGVYLPNYENKGIAMALNIGCKKAHADGFEWCMTMDQDSYWDKYELQKYLSETEKQIEGDPLAVSIAPDLIQPVVLSVAALLKRRILGKHYRFREEPLKPAVVYPNAVITSGNIICLDVWNKVGGFLEELFIDEVDHEFCFRLKRCGYHIVKLNLAKMNHCLGESRRNLFPKKTHHQGKRLYYIIRNQRAMMFFYPEFTETYPVKIKEYIIECCIFNMNFVRNSYYFLKGWFACNKRFLGLIKHKLSP